MATPGYTSYLVECYSPGDPVRLAHSVLAAGAALAADSAFSTSSALTAASAGAAGAGDGAGSFQCVGCLAVPSDDAGLFVFESRSLPELEHGLTALGLEYERIVEVVTLCRS